jgi:catechol 2,3-dioxygenase-like lactoylglutathione lyase family enzyme
MMSGSVAGVDHVSLPMRDTEAMISFYGSLGFDVVEHPAVVSVYAGAQMINFHRPAIWQKPGFTLRAPAATPPCGDLCFVWEGSQESLATLLEGRAVIEEGPVARHGGRRTDGMSVYVRDPDGNLIEFIVYGG